MIENDKTNHKLFMQRPIQNINNSLYSTFHTKILNSQVIKYQYYRTDIAGNDF